MEKQRDTRWNFGAAMIDAAGWGFGMSLISATTVLPLFVRQLTDSPMAVGLIQAAMLFGWLVPGILVSGWLERLPRVKPSVMWIAALERSTLLLMVPFCLWVGPVNRKALLVLFFLCWFTMNAAVGANLPGYYKLIAKTIPPEMRGRLYGIGGALSGLLGAAAALPAGWLLQRWGFPKGYAACFLGAFIAMTLSVAPLGWMRETAQAPTELPARTSPWRSLGLVREDRRLLWLCAGVALFSLNGMASGFYTLFALQRFHATAANVAEFTAALMAARTGGFLLVGWLGDRHGNRVALQVSTAAGIAAAGMAVAAPGIGWMFPVFGLNELAVQGWGVCSMNYVLELCPPQRSGTYTAVYGAVTGPFRVVTPLLGGAIAAVVGFGPLFGAAVAGGVLALALLVLRLPEPRSALAVQDGGSAAGPVPAHVEERAARGD
jgi:MFS family permease